MAYIWNRRFAQGKYEQFITWRPLIGNRMFQEEIIYQGHEKKIYFQQK